MKRAERPGERGLGSDPFLQGDGTLPFLIRLRERGMRLARHCNDALDTAELQVQQLALAGEQIS